MDRNTRTASQKYATLARVFPYTPLKSYEIVRKIRSVKNGRYCSCPQRYLLVFLC